MLIVDYFTGFIWVKGYLKYTTNKIIDIFENHLSSIFDHSKRVYLDNGSYFINQKVQSYFQERNMTYFTKLVSHNIPQMLPFFYLS